MREETDEELIARSRTAATEDVRNNIIEELFGRHYRRVALWCIRWTGDREAAQDLAQEIFLKVHRNLDSFQGGSRFTTWLYTVSKNHCINSGMSSRLRECVELDEVLSATLQSADPNPEQQLSSLRQVALARELVDRCLDDTERRVLLLHYVEGWSLPMVSRALKLTNPSGAKAYIVSGHRKLKSAVERLKSNVARPPGGSDEGTVAR
jgi:RNA polymerase sigma-70 factor (ECF subfamily)